MKILYSFLAIIALLYFALCTVLYFYQEHLIFYPQKLAKNYPFNFKQPFEELTITTADKTQLNGLLFTTPNPKGLIFYLHGNAGSLASWGDTAKTYTNLGYDVFLLDYRGYGKSDGKITSQQQLFEDSQQAYDLLKSRYNESNITVIGYSVGTGLASHLACNNHPKRLILQAPYYSLTDMMQHEFPIVPTMLLKYRLETNVYLSKCTMPVIIFHGDKDEVIYYGSSLRLQDTFKPSDKLITLQGQMHNGMTENKAYQQHITKILVD